MNPIFANKILNMKNYLLLLLSLSIFASCNSQTKPKQNAEAPKEVFKTLEAGEVCYTIGDQYAGEFIIGDEIPKQEYLENFKIKRNKLTKSIEDEEVMEITYTISKDDKDLLILIPSVNEEQLEIIKEIEVISDKYKTSFGITIGSELEDFVSIYPDYKIWYSYVGDIYVIESPEIQAQFFLSKKDFTATIENTKDIAELKILDFKANSKIQKIRIL